MKGRALVIVEEVDMIELVQSAINRKQLTNEVRVVGVSWNEEISAFVIQLDPENGYGHHPTLPSLGGRARSAKLTPERRSEIARTAAKARWAKRKET